LGLSLKATGSSVVLNPPLVISDTEMQSALETLERAIRSATAGVR
jgi:4-aminobutyrate aminotransferase-like enzyme